MAFCYICLVNKHPLKDLMLKDETNVGLMEKLRSCVSEVDWAEYKKLMICGKCIKKLNKAYDFKEKCLQSAKTINLQLKTVQMEQEKQAESPMLNYLSLQNNKTNGTNAFPPITKIILTNQNTSFQNVVLNLLPQCQQIANFDGKTDVVIPQLIHIAPNISTNVDNKSIKIENNDDINKIINSTYKEEMSIEIDPLDYDTVDEVMNDNDNSNRNESDFLGNDDNIVEDGEYSDVEKVDFFNSGHFLSQVLDKSERYYCDKCCTQFETNQILHQHILNLHNAQYPYKCEECEMEFASRSSYRAHANNRHPIDLDSNVTITLKDFKTNNPKITELLNHINVSNDLIHLYNINRDHLPNIKKISEKEPEGDEAISCTLCKKSFSTELGLIRHHAKSHKSEDKTFSPKKHFIKGEKNAQCDICNKYFSTHSYMLLHRKLHEKRNSLKWNKIFKHKTVTNTTDDYKLTTEDSEDDKSDLKPIKLANINLTLSSLMSKCENKQSNRTYCIYCGKTFGRKYEMRRHVNNVHLKCLEYICHYCNDIFEDPAFLSLHIKTHCVAKCQICGSTWNDIDELKTHQLAIHNGTGKGICGVCSKRHDSLEALDKHLNKHMNQYQCHLCDNILNNVDDLTAHLYQHYTTTNHLGKEILTREFIKCLHCFHSYKSSQSLKQHLKKSHWSRKPKPKIET